MGFSKAWGLVDDACFYGVVCPAGITAWLLPVSPTTRASPARLIWSSNQDSPGKVVRWALLPLLMMMPAVGEVPSQSDFPALACVHHA